MELLPIQATRICNNFGTVAEHQGSPIYYCVFVLQEFTANVEKGSTAFNPIKPTRCRYVKIFPLRWVNGIALRVELYGYDAGNERFSMS